MVKVKTINKYISNVWTVTRFTADELTRYAVSLSLQETRRGLLTLSMAMLVLLVAQAALFSHLESSQSYFYTCTLLALLAVHIYISARTVQEVRTLHMLGITLLVISGAAFVLLAHQTGVLSLEVFAGAALLFMVIPMMPWGLREAILVMLLIYGLLTGSLLFKPGGFDTDTVVILQFVMIGASAISLVLVARNVMVRRDDITARFELERAHDRLMHLSNRDSLTSAWNRRYLQNHFNSRVSEWQTQGRRCHFAFLDVDDFKPINDTYGHEYGDEVLKWISSAFTGALDGRGVLIRMGGDEFALLFTGDEPRGVIETGEAKFKKSVQGSGKSGSSAITVSVGVVSFPPGITVDITQAYREADEALYQAKEHKLGQGGDHLVEIQIDESGGLGTRPSERV